VDYESGMLFTDGLPSQDIGYRGASAAAAAGISYRQLDYWDRTSLVIPSIQTATGSGSQRLYSFRDILVFEACEATVGHWSFPAADSSCC